MAFTIEMQQENYQRQGKMNEANEWKYIIRRISEKYIQGVFSGHRKWKEAKCEEKVESF